MTRTNSPGVLGPLETVKRAFHEWRGHENRWWRRKCSCSLDAFVAVDGLLKAGYVVIQSDEIVS